MCTLQDWIDAGKAGPFESRISYPDGSPVPHFTCRCGRVVPADMMLDLAPESAPGVPETIRGRDRFRCDGCWTRWIRRRQITPHDFRVATAQRPLAVGSRKLW